MQDEQKKVKYQRNLSLLIEIESTGISITHLAKKIGYSREVLSKMLNGHYKGNNIIRLLFDYLKLSNVEHFLATGEIIKSDNTQSK